jgi:hypothetical protein
MKKILVAGAALMLMSGSAVTVHAVHFPSPEQPAPAAGVVPVKPGVVLNGDARVRLGYQSEEYYNRFGNLSAPDSQVNMDSRVRFNLTGTAAGGAYAKARIRFMENNMGDGDMDGLSIARGTQDNLWADLAYVGIPFTDTFTLELGKYRSTYGPMTVTHNFFYDDVHLTGARGIMKVGGVTVNPFIEWMEEAQTDGAAIDRLEDNDALRFGVHAKGKIQAWTVGGMLGYQTDDRNETAVFEQNDGFFASLYTSGRAGAFGLIAEIAMTDSDLNNFNAWEDDGGVTAGVIANDRIGSDDTGFGGYVFPNYQIDKLNIGLNLGFTDGGFTPDRAFGFVMMGSTDNSRISAIRMGDTGDWLWAGLVAEYSISESLKLTGNLVYADIDAWGSKGTNGDGPNTTSGALFAPLDSAWEISAVLQYTISKGADVFFSAGYLAPEFDNSALEDDGAFGALSRLEIKF